MKRHASTIIEIILYFPPRYTSPMGKLKRKYQKVVVDFRIRRIGKETSSRVLLDG